MAETILTKKGKTFLTNSFSKGTKIELTKCLISSYIGNLDAVENIIDIQVEDTIDISEINYENGNIEVNVFIPADRGDYSVSTLCLVDDSLNLISLTRVQEFLKLQNKNELNYTITFSFENSEIVLKRDEKTPVTKKILDETLLSYSKITDIENLASKQDVLILDSKTTEKLNTINNNINLETLNRQKSLNDLTNTISREYITNTVLNNTISDYVTNSDFNDNRFQVSNKINSLNDDIIKKLDIENFTIYKNSIDKVIEGNRSLLDGKITQVSDSVLGLDKKMEELKLDNSIIRQKIEAVEGLDDNYIKTIIDTNINNKITPLESSIITNINTNNITPLKNDVNKLNLLTTEIKTLADNNKTNLDNLNNTQTIKNNDFDAGIKNLKLKLDDLTSKLSSSNTNSEEVNRNNLLEIENIKNDISKLFSKLPLGVDSNSDFNLVTKTYVDDMFLTDEEFNETLILLNEKISLINNTIENNKITLKSDVSNLDIKITNLETNANSSLEKITNNSNDITLLKNKNDNLNLKITNLENKTLMEKNSGIIINNINVNYEDYFFIDVDVLKPVYICCDLKGLKNNGLKIKLENIICNNSNSCEKIISENGYFSFFIIPTNTSLGLYFASTEGEINEVNKFYVYQ